LDATATVLGAFKDRGFEERSVTLGAGDRLVLFSDGFSEAKMDELAEDASEEWARKTIMALAPLRENGLASALASAAASGEQQADDITVMDLRCC
jgi:serine phosphatase RsbU (regulator of sigma subunit)